jgi:hypothetical protein
MRRGSALFCALFPPLRRAPRANTNERFSCRAGKSELVFRHQLLTSVGSNMSGLCLANIGRRAREYTPQLFERRTDHHHPARRQLEFPNGGFVIAGTLLHHRHDPSYKPIRFKVAKHDHGVAQVAYVQWRMIGPVNPCWASTNMVTTPSWSR